jgi:hypothetical protein
VIISACRKQWATVLAGGRKLSKGAKKANAALSALRAPIERVVAHFKNWRILHTDYRRSYTTYPDAFHAARALFFFSIR